MELNKNYLIQLTDRVYKITLLFPKKEPLRYKIRELADNILTESNERDLEVLDSFFEVAKNQNWVSPAEILSLQEEYRKLSQEMKKSSEAQSELKLLKPVLEKEKIIQPTSKAVFINERQEKILEILKEKDKTQVWEIQKVFPEVSKRTLRRDFSFLLERGLVERKGDKNTTFYQIKH